MLLQSCCFISLSVHSDIRLTDDRVAVYDVDVTGPARDLPRDTSQPSHAIWPYCGILTLGKSSIHFIGYSGNFSFYITKYFFTVNASFKSIDKVILILAVF